MNTDDKLALIHKHLDAEGAGDVETACSVYADDIEHDTVGFPGAPCFGIDAAKAFYEHLTANIRTTGEKPLHQYETSDGTVILEAQMSADVIGELLDAAYRGRQLTATPVGHFIGMLNAFLIPVQRGTADALYQNRGFIADATKGALR